MISPNNTMENLNELLDFVNLSTFFLNSILCQSFTSTLLHRRKKTMTKYHFVNKNDIIFLSFAIVINFIHIKAQKT